MHKVIKYTMGRIKNNWQGILLAFVAGLLVGIFSK